MTTQRRRSVNISSGRGIANLPWKHFLNITTKPEWQFFFLVVSFAHPDRIIFFQFQTAQKCPRGNRNWVRTQQDCLRIALVLRFENFWSCIFVFVFWTVRPDTPDIPFSVLGRSYIVFAGDFNDGTVTLMLSCYLAISWIVLLFPRNPAPVNCRRQENPWDISQKNLLCIVHHQLQGSKLRKFLPLKDSSYLFVSFRNFFF